MEDDSLVNYLVSQTTPPAAPPIVNQALENARDTTVGGTPATMASAPTSAQDFVNRLLGILNPTPSGNKIQDAIARARNRNSPGLWSAFRSGTRDQMAAAFANPELQRALQHARMRGAYAPLRARVAGMYPAAEGAPAFTGFSPAVPFGNPVTPAPAPAPAPAALAPFGGHPPAPYGGNPFVKGPSMSSYFYNPPIPHRTGPGRPMWAAPGYTVG